MKTPLIIVFHQCPIAFSNSEGAAFLRTFQDVWCHSHQQPLSPRSGPAHSRLLPYDACSQNGAFPSFDLPDIPVHIGFNNFPEHSLFRVFSVVLLMPIFYYLIFPTPMGTTGSVRNACLYDSTVPDDDVFLFKLTVYFTQNRIVQKGFYQCVSETVDDGAVESSVCHAQTDETAEREAAVHLILNFTVTLSIPCTQKFGLEQHQAIITRATYWFMVLSIADFYNTSYGSPIDYPAYIEEDQLDLVWPRSRPIKLGEDDFCFMI